MKNWENKKNLSLYWKMLKLNLSLFKECMFKKILWASIFTNFREHYLFFNYMDPLIRTSCPTHYRGGATRGACPPSCEPGFIQFEIQFIKRIWCVYTALLLFLMFIRLIRLFKIIVWGLQSSYFSTVLWTFYKNPQDKLPLLS